MRQFYLYTHRNLTGWFFHFRIGILEDIYFPLILLEYFPCDKNMPTYLLMFPIVRKSLCIWIYDLFIAGSTLLWFSLSCYHWHNETNPYRKCCDADPPFKNTLSNNSPDFLCMAIMLINIYISQNMQVSFCMPMCIYFLLMLYIWKWTWHFSFLWF